MRHVAVTPTRQRFDGLTRIALRQPVHTSIWRSDAADCYFDRMDRLYTKDGRPLRVDGEKVFDESGLQVGRIRGEKIFGPDGSYAATIVGDRAVLPSLTPMRPHAPKPTRGKWRSGASVTSDIRRHLDAAEWSSRRNNGRSPLRDCWHTIQCDRKSTSIHCAICASTVSAILNTSNGL